jgi:hypothetical protein
VECLVAVCACARDWAGTRRIDQPAGSFTAHGTNVNAAAVGLRI